MLEIEIIESNVVDGGVEVFARAWRDGTQIGFGKDGTVEFERFVVTNPPVLVEDPNGDIEITQTYREELDIPPTVTKYREDPEEALLQVLEENLRVMKNQHGPDAIIPGKRGNTTTTEYASYSAYQFNNIASGSGWSALRSDGTSLGHDTTSQTEATLIGEFLSPNYNLARNIYHFDTSSIGSGEIITSATFSVKSTTNTGSGAETTYPANGALVGITSTPSDNTSDFGKFGTTRYADSDVLRSAFADGNATYKDWTLNSTGIADINKGGTTYLGIRMANDFSDSTVPTARSFALGYFAAATGTTNDPKLVVEHAAGATFTPRVMWFS